MKEYNLKKIIQTSQIIIHKGKYAYLKTKKKSLLNHFFVSQDQDEITIVTRESNVNNTPHTEIVKWFKLFEFRVSAPFVTVGFLAKVANTIADKGLNILIISTFSKDYILVRAETYKQASDALKLIGFPIIEE